MKSGKIAVFGLILAAAMVSAAAARAEVSIGGGIEGYMPSARAYVIILPATLHGADAKAAGEAAAAPLKAVQPAVAVAAAVEIASVVKDAEKKVIVAQAAKAGKKARARRGKKRIASGAIAAPKAAAVRVS